MAPARLLSARHGLGRWLCSHLYRGATWLLFRLPVEDTQTGLKVFRREALAEVLPYSQENRFVFDVELLALLHRHHYRRIAHVPVQFRPRTTSTVGLTAILLMIADTLRLYACLRWRPGPGTAAQPHLPSIPRPQTTKADQQAALRSAFDTPN